MALIQKWDYLRDELGYPCSNHDCYDSGKYSTDCSATCPEHYDIEWTDNVGGYHSNGVGTNPNGVFCGECAKESCEFCPNKEAT